MMTLPLAWQSPRPAHRGQTIVIFALASLVLLGGLGLALDGGFLLSKRRAMQNAADAAALAGATALKGNNANGFTVLATVRAIAQQNGVADPTDAAQLTCVYLDNNLQPLVSPLPTACHDAPFATGTVVSAVRVTVHETHPTFVMRALGIASAGAGATATAQIRMLTSLPNALVPFLPCGIDTKTVAANGNINGTKSILVPATGKTYKYGDDPDDPDYDDNEAEYYSASWQNANGEVKIDESAYSYNMLVNPPGSGTMSPNPYRFLIHKASGNETNGIERCTADGYSAWKGFNDRLTGDINIAGTLQLQGDYDYTAAGYPGAAGPTDTDSGYATGKGGPVYAGVGERTGPANSVPGAGGCAPGQDSDCIMLLPIVDNAVTSGNGSSGVLAARTYGAFYITKTANGNEHYGALVKNWTPHLKGNATFTIGATGVTSVLLVR